jgi:hypothetical protein
MSRRAVHVTSAAMRLGNTDRPQLYISGITLVCLSRNVNMRKKLAVLVL